MRRPILIAVTLLASASGAMAEGPFSGFYVGAVGGYGNGARDMTVPPTYTPTTDPDRNGYLIGGLTGYNLQNGPAVFGVELDFAGSNVEPRMTYLAAVGTEAIHVYSTHGYLATLRGRLGFAYGNLLMYGTAGGAWMHSRSEVVVTNGAAPNWGPGIATDSTTANHFGWAAGAGTEYAVSENLTVRVEYLHYGFGRQDYNFSTLALETSASASLDVARGAIVWKF